MRLSTVFKFLLFLDVLLFLAGDTVRRINLGIITVFVLLIVIFYKGYMGTYNKL